MDSMSVNATTNINCPSFCPRKCESKCCEDAEYSMGASNSNVTPSTSVSRISIPIRTTESTPHTSAEEVDGEIFYDSNDSLSSDPVHEITILSDSSHSGITHLANETIAPEPNRTASKCAIL